MHDAWLSDGWVEVGDQVFVRRYAFFDQNIGLILGRAEALVIDTRSTYAQAREIQEHVRELTDAPVERRGRHARPLRPRVRQCGLPAGDDLGSRTLRLVHDRTGERRKERSPPRSPGSPTSSRDRHRSAGPGVRHPRHDRGRRAGGGSALHGPRPYRPRHPHRYPRHRCRIRRRPRRERERAVLQRRLPARMAGDAPGPRRARQPDVVLVPGHGDHGGKPFLDAQIASLTKLADLARRVEAGELDLDGAVAQHPFPQHPPEDARRGFERALAQARGELDRVETST